MPDKKAVIGTRESQSARYLGIEARWDKPIFQRFLLALGDEESLHQRIAGVSVVGIGFGVCKAAAAEEPAVDCEGDHRGGQSPRQGP